MNKNYLRNIRIEKGESDKFPFNLSVFENGVNLELSKPITFILGDNGTGKSTFLENIAKSVGLNVYGGGKNNFFGEFERKDDMNLSEKIHLTWSQKTIDGFFFRAESFFNFIDYLDKQANEYGECVAYGSYGGKSFQEQSHGEAFLSLFTNRFNKGLFILDEPESALSAEKQLSLISVLNELTKNGDCQFIIATHSPILITIPNSELYEINNGLKKLESYKDSKQFNVYKDFISCPEHYLHYLCD